MDKKPQIINFFFMYNEKEVEQILKDAGFSKIGHKKKEPDGICILLPTKTFHEVDNFVNSEILEVDNLELLKSFLNQ